VEEHGEDRAILMDPVDYRLLVAMLAYHTSPVEERQVQNGASLFIGLLESTLCGMTKQERWNRVMRAYLNDEISLGRVSRQYRCSDKFCTSRKGLPKIFLDIYTLDIRLTKRHINQHFWHTTKKRLNIKVQPLFS